MLTKVTSLTLARAVLAVPPLALTEDLKINRAANAAQIRHLEAGGVTNLVYGGNANVQHWQVSQFDEWLDVLEESTGEDSWLLPSAGPDWGKLMDAAPIFKHRKFPAVMALPMISPQTPDGVVRGIEEFTARSGVPLIVYIKTDNYIPADELGRLHEQGIVFSIKYAVPRAKGAPDAYLDALIEVLGRERIVSGFGEPPAYDHLLKFGLAGFTAGCVCIAPTLSMRYLAALQSGNADAASKALQPFMKLEALRERANPIRVLHAAVSFSGVADMGPILPMMSLPHAGEHADIKAAARELYEAEMAARSVPAQ